MTSEYIFSHMRDTNMFCGRVDENGCIKNRGKCALTMGHTEQESIRENHNDFTLNCTKSVGDLYRLRIGKK